MEWKTVKLGEVCKIFGRIGFRGYTNNDFVTKPEDGAITLSPTNIVDGELDLTKCAYINWNKYYESPEIMVQENDILLSKTGTIGRTALVKRVEHPMTINPQFVLLKECTINPRYLSYLLKTSKFQGDLYSITVGSVIATLSQKNLGNIKIDIVDSASQDKIVSILSSLDDKIENNNRINRNLEAQAQALFKSWFVDYEPWGGTMPDDWKGVSLNEMTSKFGTGLNPRKNFKLGEGENYYVTIKNMGNNRVYLDDRCDKVTDEAIEKINKRSKLQAGDLLFSGIGTIGRVALVTETPTNWNTSESVFNLHPANNISSEFLYVLLLSDVFQNYVKVHTQGGVQQGIRMASLKDYKMYIPEESKMKQFDSLIIPIITRIKNIDKENDRLATLRDTLLPKLMKGEIEV